MAAPWFKVYPKDLLADSKVMLLEDDQLGKLLKLWCFAAQEDCTIPADPYAIGKLLGIQNRNHMVKQMVWVSQFFVPSETPNRLVSLRLLEEQRAYETKCEKLRANGSLGGRPKKPDGLPDGEPKEKPDDKQTPPELRTQKKEKDKRCTLPEGKVTPEAENPPSVEVSPKDSSPIVLTLPCIGRGPKEWPVTQARILEWREAFPGVDAESEARKMRLWLQGNPDRQKTHRGMPRFALGWLERSQNSRRGPGARGGGGGAGGGTICPNSRAPESEEAFLAQLEGITFEEVANA